MLDRFCQIARRWRIGKLDMSAFLRCRAGGVSTIFGFSFLVLLGFAGSAVDLANLNMQKTNLQGVADRSALAAARELRLANVTNASILQAANNFALAHAGGNPITFDGSVSTDRTSITVKLSHSVNTILMQYLGPSQVTIGATATAKIVGGSPICMIGLNATASNTIYLEHSATLNASTCAVYSNSSSSNAINAKNAAKLTTAVSCVVGGYSGAPASFTPTPQTNCPAIPDPLASRAGPTPGACTYNKLSITSGAQSILPGTYCGGLKIAGGANVTAQPGVYIIQDGPLSVSGNATLSGVGAGFYFTGTGAVINFTGDSNISLTAPDTGPMAGMLFFEDGGAAPGQIHTISSDNAHILLGTVYLPRGTLTVGSTGLIAEKSAFTIVVADKLTFTAGPTMVLNTNYGATTVPVPNGLGSTGQNTVLSQ